MPTKKTSAKKITKKAAATKATLKKKSASPTKVTNKKVAKKTTTKKPVAKKTAPKKKATTKKQSKDLIFAADHESFWTTDGQILNSLLALSDALGSMNTEVFEFHSDGDQNDFSVGVELVLCDGDCAAELNKAKTQKKAQSVVTKHLKNYAL